MKKIIVPVDFSATSLNAAQFAAELASFYTADIVLYHTYKLPVVLHEFSYPVFDLNETQEAAEHELLVIKEKINSKLNLEPAITILAEMIELQVGLAALCDLLKPDLVIMGLSGKNVLTRLIVGSNTIKTIQELNYPILVIPPKAEFFPIKKMGFACDYRNIKKSTPVTFFKKILNDFRADLYVLNINQPGQTISDDSINESSMLHDLLKDIKPLYNTIEAGDVIEGINWFIKKEKLDWIVVIPKKHPLLQKMFSRSHTKDLLYHTHVPVLCIHE